MSIPTFTRGPVAVEVLVWVTAQNRSTGVAETMGLWTGSETRTFTVDGSPRSYTGAGGILDVPSLVSQMGLKVQTQQAGLSQISSEVEQLIRGYDARLAPVEIHLAKFNPSTQALQSIDRVHKGWLDKIVLRDGGKNKDAAVRATIVSAARELTRTVPDYRSDQAHQDRTSGADRAFRYADVSGSVPVFWGQKR